MGAKVIWMPTRGSVVDKKRKGESGGIYILDKDNQPEYRSGFSQDRTFDAVSLWDLKRGEVIPNQRRGLCHIGEVTEMRIPLCFIRNENEFGVQIGFKGQRDGQFFTIDLTDWAYVLKK